jgi:hypothetical protein
MIHNASQSRLLPEREWKRIVRAIPFRVWMLFYKKGGTFCSAFEQSLRTAGFGLFQAEGSGSMSIPKTRPNAS